MTNKPVFFSNHRVRRKDLKIKNTYDTVDLSENLKKRNILDIGFGDGDSLIKTPKQENQEIYGIESYSIGVNKIINFINKENIKNVHIHQGDVVEIIDIFPDRFFDFVNIFFPDPWPKRRHHKRRFVSKYFLDRLRNKVKHNNRIHIASDHINFIFDIKRILDEYLKQKVQFSNHRSERPITKYENKAIIKRRIIFDLIFSL